MHTMFIGIFVTYDQLTFIIRASTEEFYRTASPKTGHVGGVNSCKDFLTQLELF